MLSQDEQELLPHKSISSTASHTCLSCDQVVHFQYPDVPRYAYRESGDPAPALDTVQMIILGCGNITTFLDPPKRRHTICSRKLVVKYLP